jgi:methionyl-tRNA formyltransferase
MDAELDTGNILAQAPVLLDDEHSWEELEPKMVTLIGDLLPAALARVEQGDPGDPQVGEGSYDPLFEPEYRWIDWTKPAAEVYRQVRAWRFASGSDAERGALTELDGETVRVLRLSRDPADGRAMECADGTLWIVESEAA